MLPSFILSLREGLEAALIIGIVLGALFKMGRQDLKPAVWRGAGLAVVFSLITAGILLSFGSEFEGRAENIFEGAAMLTAAVVLTWMIFWMRRQASSLRTNIETEVQTAAGQTGNRALFALAFLAIAREGLELSLFLTASTFISDAWQTLVGAVAGIAFAILLGYLLYSTTRLLSLRRFFQVTNLLLILFAAGLVAHGVHELNEAGLIPPVIEHVWDTNFLLDEQAGLGTIMVALFGYNGNPSLTELIAYVSYFIILIILFKTVPQRIPQKNLPNPAGT